jgi:hypothetical protein
MSYDALRAQADTAYGLAAPTLAFGLTHLASYSSQAPFIDLALVRRDWVATTPDGPIRGDALDPYLNDGNWPTSIPEGADGIYTLWNWSKDEATGAEGRKGLYVFTWEGEGTVQVNGAGTVVEQTHGRIVFDNTRGGNIRFTITITITKTDPDGVGDPIRDVSLIRAEHQDLFDAGVMFDPEWIAGLSDARQLRFMDWMYTNNSMVSDWSERPTMTSGDWETNGVPVEVMVRLANETGADPWFNMPLLATEEYVREFATYVRDNLDPRLQATVEFSNEIWNAAFKQLSQLREAFAEDWPDASLSGTGATNYHSKRMTENALIWDDVFGEESDARLFKVVSTQGTSTWRTEALLNPVTWFEQEPDTAVNPADVFDAVAVASYFGGKTMLFADLRAELVAAIEDPAVDAAAWLHDKLLDPDYRGSLPYAHTIYQEQKAVAEAYGLGLVAYEGGQHVHQLFNVRGVENLQLLTDFMTVFVRSDYMGDLYEQLWAYWADVSDGPFMQYGYMGQSSQWGSWALYDFLGDSTPRSEALEALNARSEVWWDAGDRGDAFLNGVSLTGTDADDVLIGSSEEDILLGGAGDDVLVGGAGDDRIHGGEGVDVTVFAGLSTDYLITAEGDGWLVEGADGSDHLIAVERVAFDDGEMSIEEAIGLIHAALEATTLVPDGEDFAYPGGSPAPVMLISGGEGDDELRGDEAADVIDGASGNDKLYGADGDDQLFGGAGADRLHAGAGDDILDGGEGNDLLCGDKGSDTCGFGQGVDRIYGYEEQDMLDLRALHLGADANLADIAHENAYGNLCIGVDGDEFRLVGLSLADIGIVDALFV